MNKKEEGVPDFVLLDKLTEEAIMENLTKRFKADQIYTYIGDVVISVNPFKKLNIYKPTDIDSYRGRYKYEMPPHIFALANDAYRSMMQNKRNQCIIISGESGAGKTEASKIVMQYITAVSQSSGDVDRVKRQLLESNPLLEAFGNAKTLRNDNSSRFGKYMEMQFNSAGSPVGGRITNYLLEKSRVVSRAIGERSFHIFYQMLSGLPNDKISSLGISKAPNDYTYLKQSECFTVPTIDDVADFKAVVRAMDVLGLKEPDQNSLWKVLSAVLLLGNVAFVEHEDTASNQPYVEIVDQDVVGRISTLLGCEQHVLSKALTHRTITSGMQRRMSTIIVPLDTAQAVYSRDALAKTLYERIFQWLVSRINTNIHAHEKDSDFHVDIYGFEIFERNSFEQLNINLISTLISSIYCNEKLQQLFIELTLKSEQEEYVSEGIEWEPVKYFNNKTICELIEKKPIGLLSLLDEACMVGKSTDATFLESLNSHFGKHPHYQSYATSQDRTITGTSFRLKHYAGDVTYDVVGLLDKNKDTLFPDLIFAMGSSTEPLLAGLFKPLAAGDSKKRPETAGSQFRTAINALIASLLACNPHYVRCIKSNDSKQAGKIEEARVKHQVRYLGLLENVRVRRAGFANRQTFDRFFSRYKMLCKDTWPTFKQSTKEGTRKILDAHKIATSEYRLGKTKIFIRNPMTLFYFEEAREKTLPRMASLIQKIWRGYRARMSYQKHKAATKIQLWYRSHKFNKWFSSLARAFNGITSMTDLGKSVVWPKQPPVLTRAVALLHKIHNTWRATKMVKSLGAEEPAMRQKAFAYDIFNGQKQWTCGRKWEADYLALPGNNPLHAKYTVAMTKIFKSHGDSHVLFGDFVMKMNDSGKIEKRAVLVTDKHMFKLHPKNFGVRRNAIPLVDVEGISVSPNKDQFAVIHIKAPGRDLIFDMSICDHEALSELVTVVIFQALKLTGNKPKVNFTNTPSKKDFTLTIQAEPGIKEATIKKGKNNTYTGVYPA